METNKNLLSFDTPKGEMFLDLDEYKKEQYFLNKNKTKMSNTTPLGEKKIEDSEILKNLLKELRYSGLQFGKKLGYSSTASIHHVLKGTNNRQMSDDMVNRIIKEFPEVNYWYLKKGQLPIVLDGKLAQNQTNILFGKDKSITPDYSQETFNTLKNIEAILLRIEDTLNKKSEQ